MTDVICSDWEPVTVNAEQRYVMRVGSSAEIVRRYSEFPNPVYLAFDSRKQYFGLTENLGHAKIMANGGYPNDLTREGVVDSASDLMVLWNAASKYTQVFVDAEGKQFLYLGFGLYLMACNHGQCPLCEIWTQEHVDHTYREKESKCYRLTVCPPGAAIRLHYE